MKRLLIALLIALLLLTSCGKGEAPQHDDLPTEVISAIEEEIAEEHGLDVACVMLLDARELRDGYYLVELIAQAEDYHLLTYVMRFDPNEGAEVNILDWQVKGGKQND